MDGLENDGIKVYNKVQDYLVNVKQQNGVNDCGCYSITFAVHLGSTQKKRKMPFPLCKTGNHHNYFPSREIELFCSCQMPETYDDMIRDL